MTKREEGVKLLEQMEDLLYRLEKGNASKNTMLAIARVVWWMLKQWVVEHEPQKGSIWKQR